jgi:hypothetical protein
MRTASADTACGNMIPNRVKVKETVFGDYNDSTKNETKLIKSQSMISSSENLLRKKTVILSDNVLFNIPQYKEETKENKESKYIRFVYNQIFDKNLQQMVKPKYSKKLDKNDLNNKKNQEMMKKYNISNRSGFIHDKIEKIKTKVLFIKGVYDYACPQVIVKKIQVYDKLLKINKEEREKKFKIPEFASAHTGHSLINFRSINASKSRIKPMKTFNSTENNIFNNKILKRIKTTSQVIDNKETIDNKMRNTFTVNFKIVKPFS